MSVKDELADLWRHLEREGIIDGATTSRLISHYGDGWVPMGRILIQQGILTVKELMWVLECRATEPGVYLGTLAVREGFCSEEDIDRALALQRQCVPGVYELLIKEQGVDAEEFFEKLLGYVRHLEKLNHSLLNQVEMSELVSAEDRAAQSA